MPLEFTLEDYSIGVLRISTFRNSFVLNYPCENKENCTNYKVKLPPNTYLFEAWGAEGGVNGGLGGYTKGTLVIRKETNAKIFIGAKGPTLSGCCGVSNKAFNGGGYGSTGGNFTVGSGGGATDLRIGSTLNDRILVSGAGGSGVLNYYSGGSGGGFEGVPGKCKSGAEIKGATQKEPGIGDTEYGISAFYKTMSGSFGLGGYGLNGGTCGGGGAGWFGGASGAPSDFSGGSGGSGYILTASSFKPINYAHNDSTYWFISGLTKDGTSRFPSCNSSKTEIGHKGDGCFRITIINRLTCRARNQALSYSVFFVTIILSAR